MENNQKIDEVVNWLVKNQFQEKNLIYKKLETLNSDELDKIYCKFNDFPKSLLKGSKFKKLNQLTSNITSLNNHLAISKFDDKIWNNLTPEEKYSNYFENSK